MNYAQAIEMNLEHLGTAMNEWTTTPISGFQEIDGPDNSSLEIILMRLVYLKLNQVLDLAVNYAEKHPLSFVIIFNMMKISGL